MRLKTGGTTRRGSLRELGSGPAAWLLACGSVMAVACQKNHSQSSDTQVVSSGGTAGGANAARGGVAAGMLGGAGSASLGGGANAAGNGGANVASGGTNNPAAGASSASGGRQMSPPGGTHAGGNSTVGGANGGTASGGAQSSSGGRAAGGANPGSGGQTSSGSTFPVRISPDKNYLVGANGVPFLIKGDSAWSILAELSKADATTYLDSRKAHGFNTLIVNLIEPAFSSHTPKWRNAEGELPFSDPDDFTTINDAYFAHVDWFLNQAEQRGILVLLTPSYIGYQCGAEGWCSHMKANGVTKLTQYGQYLGTRYKNVGNILWIEGGDDTPSTSGTPSELDLVNAVAAGIRQAESGAHLHAAHWATEVSGMEGPSVPWLDVDTSYSYTSPQLYQKTLSDRARDAGKRPFFLIESLYENEHAATNVQLRAQMYQPVLSGSTGFLFGNFPIWGMWSPGSASWQFDDGKYPGGWKTALDGGGTKLASIAFGFLSSIAWQTLSPDTTHVLMTGGYGSGGNSALCAANAARTLAVAYLTSNLSPEFDLSRFAGAITARWFDPATGTYSAAAADTLSNSGKKTFQPPTTNGDGSADWVLLLQVN